MKSDDLYKLRFRQADFAREVSAVGLLYLSSGTLSTGVGWIDG